MHTGTLKKLALALTFWLAVHMDSLRAQTFTAPLQASTTGTNPVDFEFRADGTLMAKGNYGVGGLISSDLGVGTRMFWLPAQGAFRAGGTDSAYGIYSAPNWDTGNIGNYSFAGGLDTEVSGNYSTAFGYWSRTFGWNSISEGAYCVAGGNGSVAMGVSSGTSGEAAISLGNGNSASGTYSVALGGDAVASGFGSTAMGSCTTSSGYCTTSSGAYTTATAEASFVVGAYNIGGGNPTTWVSTDPLFEVGNGTSATALSDAMVVYKDGSAIFQGPVTIAPGGDIPMYTGE
jgi:hypothetical protein